MKKIINRAKLPPPETVVIKVDPRDIANNLVFPKIKYEISASVECETVFTGRILPIPKVLLFYLTHKELLIFVTIMEEVNKNGECELSVKEMAKKTKISIPTLSTCLYNMRKVGLLLERPNGHRGSGRIRRINYQTVQHLNDLVEGEDLGVYVRIRKATRKTVIDNLTKSDIKGAYDNFVINPEDDPIEAEEYD